MNSFISTWLWLLCSLLICSNNITFCLSEESSHEHTATACSSLSCSASDLEALRSIAAAFPTPIFAAWRAQANSLSLCCGSWGSFTSWNSLNITCSSSCHSSTSPPSNLASHSAPSGRVIGLNILYVFNGDFKRPIKSIPVAVCSLSALTSLSLYGGLLSGPAIPDCIGHNLTNLEQLDLSSNTLTGSIPPSFSRLSSLRALNLAGNSFSGPFPSSIVSGLAHLSQLDLSHNSLHGQIPNPLRLHNLTELNLGGNAFSGPLPAFHTPNLALLMLELNYITGSLSPLLELSNLTSLTLVDLRDNQLDGRLPTALLCGAAEVVLLSSNELSGHLGIPNNCNFTSLINLDISNNDFTGVFPNWLGSFVKLDRLSIAYNNFTGAFPNSLGSLLKLESLWIAYNNFSGSIPDSWQNLASLQILDLSGNKPYNKSPSAPKLPCWLFSLPSLSFLALSSMGLQDRVFCSSNCTASASAGPLSPLSDLDLSNNLFTHALLHCLPRLHVVVLAGNTYVPSLSLAGNPLSLTLHDPNVVELIPKSLYGLDLSSCKLRGHLTGPFLERLAPSVSFLNLSHNQLEGHIPVQLGNMSKLVNLDLSYNHFTGIAPLTHSQSLQQVGYMDLSNNNLSGSLSSLLANILAANASSCSHVFYSLDLSHNFLSIFGVIPPLLGQCLSASTSLHSLKLNHNRLVGSLSQLSPFLPPASLQVLSLSDNQLSGQIPSSFKNLAQLVLLDLSHNQLEGNLDLFGKSSSSNQFPLLGFLLLGSNNFTGNIPTSLGSVAPSLQMIDFSSNHLTGSIPMHSLQPLASFKVKYTVGMEQPLYEAVSIIIKGHQENFSYIPAGWTSLDLSNNMLSGPISTGLGSLLGLVYLNLSKNDLSGPIPPDVGSLGDQLQSLDLSFNKLNGSIPSTFRDLTSLEVFNVSYNEELSGQIIVTAPQLENRDSYIGDPKLCGRPVLPNACGPPLVEGSVSSPSSNKQPRESYVARVLKEWVSIPGLCLGFVVGFVGVGFLRLRTIL